MQTFSNSNQSPDTASGPARITIVCARCGSDNCGRDATARWDLAAQDWSLGGVFDNSWCDDCGGDDPGLVEVEAAYDPETDRGAALLDAARLVVARWSKGDLAEAVRQLADAVDAMVRP